MIIILKNKYTGKYFGHLDKSCSHPVDYDNIKSAFRFKYDGYGKMNLLEDTYNNISYEEELKNIKKENRFNKLKNIFKKWC